MQIEFFPSNKNIELVVPCPKPAKLYIPDWYKDIKVSNEYTFDENGQILNGRDSLKRCMPFFDGLTGGYIQESWTDIYISNKNDGFPDYFFPLGPKIMSHREHTSINFGNLYYPVEFTWYMHWLPKLPKGWSAIVTTPHNRLDLPFRSLTGIIDSDSFYSTGESGGNYPFYIQKGFNGTIPAGTPMYQIIPFKRENWKSKALKFNESEQIRNKAKIKKYIVNGYKKVHWQKKSYE